MTPSAPPNLDIITVIPTSSARTLPTPITPLTSSSQLIPANLSTATLNARRPIANPMRLPRLLRFVPVNLFNITLAATSSVRTPPTPTRPLIISSQVRPENFSTANAMIRIPADVFIRSPPRASRFPPILFAKPATITSAPRSVLNFPTPSRTVSQFIVWKIAIPAANIISDALNFSRASEMVLRVIGRVGTVANTATAPLRDRPMPVITPRAWFILSISISPIAYKDPAIKANVPPTSSMTVPRVLIVSMKLACLS